MPQVSIVMAVYNGLPYLSSSIDSILAQTLTDFELLAINDCSTDGTTELLVRYAEQDPRVKVTNLEHNKGQTAALNIGLGLAQGDYIARQDADDISKPERLATEVAFLEQNPDYLMVGTAADLIDGKGRVTGQMVHPTSYEEIVELFKTDNGVFHGSVLFRQGVLDQVGTYREGFRTSQDYDYWLRISEAGKITNLAEPLYQYRMHEGQMTFTSYYRMKAEWQLAIELAAIRNQGQDDTATYEKGAAALTTTYTNFVPTAAEKRRAMAELWRGKGVSYMNAGRRVPMMYCLFRAFLYEPNNPDFWRGVRNHIPFMK